MLAGQGVRFGGKDKLEEQLSESEKLMKEASQTWEEKEKKTQIIHQVNSHHITF